MPIVIDTQDPRLVATLASNAGQYATNEQDFQRAQQAQALALEVARRSLSAEPSAAGYGASQLGGGGGGGRQAPAAAGGTGQLSVPDGNGGFTGGARIYYPQGMAVPQGEGDQYAQTLQDSERKKKLAEHTAAQKEIEDQRFAHEKELLGQRGDQQIDLKQTPAGSPAGGYDSPAQQRLRQNDVYTHNKAANDFELKTVEDDMKELQTRRSELRQDRTHLDASKASDKARLSQIDAELTDIDKRLGTETDPKSLRGRRKAARDNERGFLTSTTQPAQSDPRGIQWGGNVPPPKIGPDGVPQITATAQRDVLPKGTLYRDPMGNLRRKT